MNVLFRNAYLYAGRTSGDLAVVDGRIHYPQDGESVRYDRVIEADGRILFKGFADIHTHLDKAMVTDRVKNQSGTLQEAIRIMGTYKASMTDEDIRERAEKVLSMCLQNGTRFIRTHVDVDKNIGIRSVEVLKKLKDEWADRIRLEIVAFPQEGITEDRENYLALEEALKAGADLVGGIPANESDPAEHIRMIFRLALKYDVDVDMHIDENDNPESLTVLELAEQTIRNNYQGRVFAGHLCSLGSCGEETVSRVMHAVREARIHIISLPSTNLYLEGRGDASCVRRGIAPIRTMMDTYGIPAAVASDNIRDPFNPFGNGNPLQTALIAAHGCHMGGMHDLENLFDSISVTPLRMMGISPVFIEGEVCPVVMLDAVSAEEAIISQSRIIEI